MFFSFLIMCILWSSSGSNFEYEFIEICSTVIVRRLRIFVRLYKISE